LSGAGHGEWDDYVARSPEATFFHRAGWMRVVREVYGHRPRYLVARDVESGRICGVLPLGAVSGPLTGRALISVPYAVGGGAVADDPEVATRLASHARELADRGGVRYLELRSGPAGDGYQVRDHYFAFRTTMPSDPAAVLGRFPRKARAEVRKARDQFGLTARFGHDLLATFYSQYVRSLRRLGSPGHSWKFLRRLVDEFGDDCLVEVVYHDGEPAAGVLSFRFRDQILPYYAGIDDRFNRYNVSNYLYYALMEHAVGLGLRVFDFGRTRRDNAGGCQFKINQGFEPEPMPYSYYSPGGAEPPDLRPSNAAFSRSRDIWSRLPLVVAGPLGGVVSRWIP
jgi:FemAB-related protein (PEP-CTERM system-associated)